MAKYIKYDADEIMKAIFNPGRHTYNEENFNELINELKQLMCDLGDICEQTDEEDIFWTIHAFLNRGKPRGDISNRIPPPKPQPRPLRQYKGR